ncbi:MAG TPA: HDOD domain-containing protein [Caldithrix abyssi]|uniref:HDOD domain-containing protein n=1 Tax=Caldithrix abyssi TaxID=187145 RepID=A0A7V5RQL8_CALAY|nr:HDOD domain-containing protein [Caldithrix abyssi]
MNKNIVEIIEQAEDFPALPHVLIQLFQLVNRDDVALSTISELISKDPSLSTRILKMVNSTYYNFQKPISNINQAVSFLGLKTLRDIAATVSMMDIFPGTQKEEYSQLFRRSLCAAITASLIAEFVGRVDKSEAFLAALLQNIGSYIYLRYMGAEYIKVLRESRASGIELPFVEKRFLHITNAQAGQIVAERWRLPRKTIMAIRYQYNIKLAYKKSLPKDVLQIIELAYLGGMAADFFTGWNKSFKRALFRTRVDRLFKKGPAVSEDILSSIPSLVNNMGFSAIIGKLDSYEEIKYQAENELVQKYTVFNKTYNRLRELEEQKESESTVDSFAQN